MTRKSLGYFLLPVACSIGIWFGCTENKPPTTQPTTRPMTAKERQDAAMKDPFGYSPNGERTDISGGGISDFDRDAFKKDVKNVLDP
jgi:hypothetical protein